jgi:hypothetical protein
VKNAPPAAVAVVVVVAVTAAVAVVAAADVANATDPFWISGRGPVKTGLRLFLFVPTRASSGQRRWFAGGQQMRAFEQAAEIFFAGDGFGAGLAGEAVQRFIFHLEPFESHDADVVSVLFPDLTLAEFHGHVVLGSNLSLLIFVRRDSGNRLLLFLFSGRSLFGGAFDLGFFSHNIVFRQVDLPAACQFLRRQGHHARRGGDCK